MSEPTVEERLARLERILLGHGAKGGIIIPTEEENAFNTRIETLAVRAVIKALISPGGK